MGGKKNSEEGFFFCVDSFGCNVDDLRSFVPALGVEVFTCYETKPRRRPDETAEDVADRNAFRICINTADRDCQLNADQRPDSVRISDWFFRGKNTEQYNSITDQGNNDKRPRIKSPDQPGGVIESLAIADCESSIGRVSADVEEGMDAVNTERDADQDAWFTEDGSVVYIRYNTVWGELCGCI